MQHAVSLMEVDYPTTTKMVTTTPPTQDTTPGVNKREVKRLTEQLLLIIAKNADDAQFTSLQRFDSQLFERLRPLVSKVGVLMS